MHLTCSSDGKTQAAGPIWPHPCQMRYMSIALIAVKRLTCPGFRQIQIKLQCSIPSKGSRRPGEERICTVSAATAEPVRCRTSCTYLYFIFLVLLTVHRSAATRPSPSQSPPSQSSMPETPAALSSIAFSTPFSVYTTIPSTPSAKLSPPSQNQSPSSSASTFTTPPSPPIWIDQILQTPSAPLQISMSSSLSAKSLALLLAPAHGLEAMMALFT